MKTIKLTRGEVALVDDEDYQWAIRYTWVLLPIGVVTPKVGGTGPGCFLPEEGLLHLDKEVARAEEDQEVRHLNGDPLDCRRSNIVIKE